MELYNDDCLKILKDIPSDSIDLIVTDPPYLMNYKTNYRKEKTHDFCTVIQNDDNFELIEQYINECYRVLKQDTAMYMFCNSNKVDYFKKCLETSGFNVKNIIVWIKNNWTAGDLEAQFGKQYEFIFLLNKGRKLFTGERLSDVWNFNRVVGDRQVHQNQKPLALINQCIRKHSNENDLVFDGFMGSGTTGVACKQLNRNFIGVEISKNYFEIAKKRIENADEEMEFENLSLF